VQGHLDVLRVVHSCGVDMEQADEEGGTSPVHIAAANGNLEVLKFMHEIGVNMEVKGTIYLDTGEDGAPQLHSNVTPLTIAQTCTGFSPDVLTFLKSICTPSQQPGKRQRTSVSTYDRAVSLGVAHRLREIPASLQGRIESGSAAEKATAKKELHSLQKANQQIVARAELQRLKQTKLEFKVQQ
jgi:hypothetical protein